MCFFSKPTTLDYYLLVKYITPNNYIGEILSVAISARSKKAKYQNYNK